MKRLYVRFTPSYTENSKFQLKEQYVFTYMIIVNIPGQIHTAIGQTRGGIEIFSASSQN